MANQEQDLHAIAAKNHEVALNLVAGLPLDHPQQAQADRVGYYRSLCEKVYDGPSMAFYIRIQAQIIRNITKALDPTSKESSFYGTVTR